MKKTLHFGMALMFVVGFSQLSLAAEHGGKEHGGKEHGGQEHGGKEHGGTAAKMPSADEIRDTMKNHVLNNYSGGTFQVKDSETGGTRKLQLVRVHERVGKTGEYYYSCADFKDTETGELLDLDLDVENEGGALKVVDVRIHKVGGVERYTYDENDNRISLAQKESSQESKGSMAHVETTQEHGGKEHGGKEHGGKEHGGKEHGGREHGGAGM